MTEDTRAGEIAAELTRLLDRVDLPEADKVLGSQCLRRIEQPLRLTIYGTDTTYAISLLNLMIGQPVIPPTLRRARVQFLHGEIPYARLQFRDGSQKRIDGSDFRRLFDDNPHRIRVYVDLPVLKRLSMLVAVDRNPKALCADASKTLGGADLAIVTGDEVTDQMQRMWRQVPQPLKDHSYIVLPHDAELEPWRVIEPDFVKVLRVAPRRAQEAKSAPGGVDKEAFRKAGGAEIVKTMKTEIEMLTRSAMDAGELLLMRYAAELAALPEPEAPSETDATDVEPPAMSSEEAAALLAEAGPVEPHGFEQLDPALLGKVASRSRLLSNRTESAGDDTPTPEPPVKNMPVRTRPISKLGSRPRIRSGRSRPAPTPWSMGL